MATIRRRDGKYEVQIRRVGLPHFSKTFHALRDAKTWARHMEVRADRNELPPSTARLRAITLEALVARYRDTVSSQKRGYHIERAVLSAFLLHPICKHRLSDITTAHFAQYRDERLRKVKPSTLKRQLGPIRNMFNVARDEWQLPLVENPLAKLKLKALDQRRERRLEGNEEKALLEAASHCRNPLIVPIIRIALETAMRRGEILATRRENVDFVERTLLIPEAKNGQARTIPLTGKALSIFRSLGKRSVLFPITGNAFRLNWERLRHKAGLDDLRFHDLRHEAISRFFDGGLTLPEVALISGHKDTRMLLRYAHPIRREVARKLRRLRSGRGRAAL